MVSFALTVPQRMASEIALLVFSLIDFKYYSIELLLCTSEHMCIFGKLDRSKEQSTQSGPKMMRTLTHYPSSVLMKMVWELGTMMSL